MSKALAKFAPGKKPPPVNERPICPGCGNPLRPAIAGGSAIHNGRFDPSIDREQREWTGQYHGYGAFCTLRCAADFANAAFRVGYRRAEKEKA